MRILLFILVLLVGCATESYIQPKFTVGQHVTTIQGFYKGHEMIIGSFRRGLCYIDHSYRESIIYKGKVFIGNNIWKPHWELCEQNLQEYKFNGK